MRTRKNPVTFTFERISSLNYNVDVLDVHEERSTVRDYSKVPINGRNGELIQDFGRYENITLVITCVIIGESVKNFHMLQAELLTLTGYHRLEHSYEPDYYRMAAFKGEVKPRVSRSADKIMFDLEFDCKPQRFLKAGENVETFTPNNVVDSGFYTYDDFGSHMQGRLKYWLQQIGYSADDVESMEYIIAPPISTPANVRITTESASPFFAIGVSTDPLTVEDTSLTHMHTDKSFYDSISGANQWYYIFQRNSPLTVKKGSTVVYEYDIFDDYQITNPTPFAASPLLRMELKSGAFNDYLISINGCNVRLNRNLSTDMGSVNAITIDCADMNAYSLPADNTDGRVINCNPFVTYTNYDIELHRGENDVLVSSNATKLELTPRWWTL